MQAWLAFAIFGVAAGGAFLVLTVSEAAGLYVPPTMARLGKGTFDYIDAVFLIVWSLIFQAMSIHNGRRHQLILSKVHVPRSRASDVGGFIGFTVVAILWGVLVRTVFAGRAVDPTYISRLPFGVPAASLQAGAQQVTATYFIVVGLVLVLIVIARVFNPIDFDEYGRYLGRLRFRSPRTTHP